MNRRGRCRATLGLLLAIAGVPMAPALAGDTPEALHGTFDAPIVVKADGSVEFGEINGAEGPVVAVIRRKLAALHYLPAQRDGVAVTTSAYLWGKVIMTPVDGQYEVSIADVSLAPLLMKAAPPDFPPEQCAADVSGTVELMLRVGPDGHVLDARTVSATHAGFEKAAKSVLGQWRFANLPEDQEWTEVPMPFLFLLAKRSTKISPFQCTAEGRARVEGEPGCLDRIEMTCTRVRTWGNESRVRVRKP